MIDSKMKTTTALFPRLWVASCIVKLSTIESSNVYSTRGSGLWQAVISAKATYSSGQVGLNKDYALHPNLGFHHPLNQTFKNIEHLQESQKCGWPEVIALRFIVVDPDTAQSERKAKYELQTFQKGQATAATTLGISALAIKNLLIEIEFITKIKQE